MTELSFLSALLIGIAGGAHCVGMCGGITLAMRTAAPVNQPHLPFAIAYHIGRILSYIIAGALTGFIGQLVSTSSAIAASILTYASIAMLFLMALYIGQWYRGLVYIEQLGNYLWRYIQPISKHFIPFKTPLHALPYGLLWGWLPCGLVYSTLTWALASQNPLEGALIMLGFGLGTFPVMLLTSMGASTLISLFKQNLTRQLASTGILFYGGFLLYTNLW